MKRTAFWAALLGCVPAFGAVVYQNDFQMAAGPGWSGAPANIISTPSGHHKFLGSYHTWGFNNETANLTLTGLAPHTMMTVSFDLYIIQSWDGHSGCGGGADIWGFALDGADQLKATFGVACGPQSYPGNYPGSNNGARTGQWGPDNQLGYGFYGDSIYKLTFVLVHNSNTAVLTFRDFGLQSPGDESWGIDNLVVEIDASSVPEPSTLALGAAGALALLARKRLTGR